jgi:GNAT superfamily N-acetyltransferase
MVADQPVGGGALLAHEGLGIFSMDGTLPQFRNRGVQAALIRARLAAAITAGCDLGLAHTSPGSTSQRSYERQGFRVAYSRATLVRSLSPSGVHKCHAKEET